MLHVAKFGAFVIFLGLGYRIAFLRSAQARRRGVSTLLIYLAVLHGMVTLAQRDAWPFSSYPLVMYVGRPDARASEITFRGVDAGGREWPVDPFAWSPVSPLVLKSWFTHVYPSLRDEERRRAEAFLLAKAEDARQTLARGGRLGADRILGGLAFPPDWGRYRRARGPVDVAFTGLRVYEVCWRPSERAGDPARVQRRLLADYSWR
jgi:hypothetical protein